MQGSTVGPPTCRALKKEYGDDEVAWYTEPPSPSPMPKTRQPLLLKKKTTSLPCPSSQGVGGAYTANIASNTLPSGTTSAGIKEGTSMYTLAAKQCPDAAIVGSGYSQGAALTAAVITDLDDAVKKQTKGAVLYGYTKNKQNDGQIPEYPADQTKVFCNASDGVCGGMLAVTPGHMTYTADVEDAVAFLKPLIG